MYLTLRQARRLEREIETTIAQVLQNNVHTRNVQVSVYEDFEATVAKANATALKGVEDATKLTGIRFGIRRSIQALHETKGLNDLMNEEAQLRSQLKFVEAAAAAEFTDAEKAIAAHRHEAAKTAPVTNTYGGPNDSITLHTVVTKESLDLLKAQKRAISRRLLDVVDELAKLNTSEKIEVNDEVIQYLESFGLVV